MKNEIVEKYANDIFKYLISLTGNSQVAEDLTQETLYQAVKSINKYDGSCKITTWLCAIAKNIYKEYVRKEFKHKDNIPIDNIQISYNDDFSNTQYIYKEIHNLGEPYNEIILLRALSDMSFLQIGEIFNKSESWARVTFYRAKQKLKERLDNYDKD